MSKYPNEQITESITQDRIIIDGSKITPKKGRKIEIVDKHKRKIYTLNKTRNGKYLFN